MNAQELYDTFRSDVVDVKKPYFWSDDEVFRYMNAAYRMFVRLVGGIADFTTPEVTQLPLDVGEDVYDLHPSILRIRQVMRQSDNAEVKVINDLDQTNLFRSAYDYGQFRTLLQSNQPGAVRYLVTGQQRNKARVIQIPMVADTLLMDVYRLPLTDVVDGAHPLDDVDKDHHIYLLDWMKHLAYRKADAETFDKGKSDDFEVSFRAYCSQAKAEWDRYKHKPRTVAYGGI